MRKRSSTRWILLAAGLLLAAVLFVRLYHPLTATEVPQVEPDLLGMGKNRIVWAHEDALHAIRPKGKEIFHLPLGFTPDTVQMEEDLIIAANREQMLVTDADGKEPIRIPLVDPAEFVQTAHGRILVFSKNKMAVYDRAGEIINTYEAEDPVILAKSIGDTLYVLTGRSDAETVRGTLYEAKDGVLTARFPVVGELIIDFAGNGEHLAVATPRTVYVNDVPLPVIAYRGMAFSDELLLLDGQTVKTIDPSGVVQKETDIGSTDLRMAGADPPVLWNDSGITLPMAEEEWKHIAMPVRKVQTQDGAVFVYAEGKVLQGTPKAYEKLQEGE